MKTHPLLPRPSLLLTASLLALAAGCAKVSVRKVPTPTQYIQWTDSLQRQADYMEGFRFYLPRPFVNVFESFPVRTDVAFATGVVDPSGQFVVITKVENDSKMSDIFMSPLTSFPNRISYKYVKVADSVLGGQKHGSGTGSHVAQNSPQNQGINAGTANTVVTGKASATSGPTTGGPGGTRTSSGVSTRGVTNDNAAFAYQPMRGNMDIVYLPDFEEQYAVSSKAALGNAQFSLNLGQGWSLQGFNSIEDNSRLNELFYGFLENASKTAQELGRRSLGFPIPSSMSPTNSLMLAENKGTEGDANPLLELQGTFVTLKIAVIHYAAKGLYPVIKPRELQARKKEGISGLTILGLKITTPVAASEYNEFEIAKAIKEIDGPKSNFTTPKYPYQFLSFNTFKYLYVEVVEASTTRGPMPYLYDGTGTGKNTDGAARNNDRDLVALATSLATMKKEASSPDAKNLAKPQIVQAVLDELKGLTNIVFSAKTNTITNATQAAGGEPVRLSFASVLPENIDQDQLTQKIHALIDQQLQKKLAKEAMDQLKSVEYIQETDSSQNKMGLEALRSAVKKLEGEKLKVDEDDFKISEATYSESGKIVQLKLDPSRVFTDTKLRGAILDILAEAKISETEKQQLFNPDNKFKSQ